MQFNLEHLLKYLNTMKHLIKYTSVILLMTLAATLFQSCGKQEPPKTIEINTFDDLKYFQSSIVCVDSLGNFKYRALGKPLNANDTTHLFIGVDDLTEAERFFRQWIAPDVEISEDQGNLICPPTDKDGNAQGTVYFRPASSNDHVAEVSASNDTRLLYFRRVTFMYNHAWPLTEPQSIWHKFDIVHNLDISIKDHLKDEDKSLNWVCVRESGNGVPPLFCTVLNENYPCLGWGTELEDTDHEEIRVSSYCPHISTAQSIGTILQADWDLFRAVFQEANGNDNLTEQLWVDETHTSWLQRFYSLIFYHGNNTYGEYDAWFPFLLKINWVDDEDIYDGASISG